MFCGQCGKPIDADSKFCPHCGARVSAEPAAASPPPPPPPPRAQPAVSGTSTGASPVTSAGGSSAASASGSFGATPGSVGAASGAASPGAGTGTGAGAAASAAAASMSAAASDAAHAAGAALDKVDARGIVARVKAILLTPRTEWPVIAGEAKTAADIWVGYVLPIAGAAAIAGAIWLMIFGKSMPLVGRFHVGFGTAISSAVIDLAGAFLGVFVMSLIINALAPTFGGQKDSLRAVKVMAYSATAAWVGGLVANIPVLGVLGGLFGFYGLYLLYTGLPVLMRSPPERALGYTVVVILCGIGVGIVIMLIGMMFGMQRAMMGGIGMSGSDRDSAATASVLSSMMGGKSDADRQRMQDAMSTITKMGKDAEQAERTAKANGQDPGAAAAKAIDLNTALAAVGTMASGGKEVKPVDFHALEELLPASVDTFRRTEATGQSGEAAGMKGSSASGRYSDGGQGTLTIEVTDIGSLSGLAAFATRFNPNSEKETGTGYDRTRTVNGNLMHQRYDRQSKSGEYGVMIANRFAIAASGSNVSESTLADAVKSVDLKKLAALAR